MIKVDIGLKKTYKKPEFYDIVSLRYKPETLTDKLDSLKVIINAFKVSGMETIGSVINRVGGMDIADEDDMAVVKIVDMITNITNNPGLATDYTYLIGMLETDSESYASIEGSVGTLTIRLEQPANPDLPIEEVIATLFSVLGYDNLMVVMACIRNSYKFGLGNGD